MITRIACAASALVTLLLPASAPAEIFKWTDESGKVHYSQMRPAGVAAAVFKPVAPPPDAGHPDPALQKRVEGFNERREMRKASEHKLAEAKEAAQQRTEDCQRARQNLETLKTHGRVSIKEGDTYRALGEEERQAQIAAAQGYVDESCTQVVSDR